MLRALGVRLLFASLVGLTATTAWSVPPDNTDQDLISQIPLQVGNAQGLSYLDAESDGRGRMMIAFIQFEKVLLPTRGIIPFLKVYARGVTLPFTWTPCLSVQLSSSVSDSVLGLNLTAPQWVDGLTAPRKGFVVVSIKRAATNTTELLYFSGPSGAGNWSLLPGGLAAHTIFSGPAIPTTPQDVSATIAALRINQADYQQLFVGVLFLDYNAGQGLRYVRLIRVTENANSLTTSTTNVTGPGSPTGDAGSVGWPRFASDAQNLAGLVTYQIPTAQQGYTKVWKLTPTLNPFVYELVGSTSVNGSCHRAEIKAQQGQTTMTCLGMANPTVANAFALDWYSFVAAAGNGLGSARNLHGSCASTGDIELFRDEGHITATCMTGAGWFAKWRALAWDSEDVTLGTTINTAVKINDWGITQYARPRVVCAPPGNSPAFCDHVYATGNSFEWPFGGSPTPNSLLNLDPT
jgi:hypothetical protein